MAEKSAGAIIFRKESEKTLFLLLHYPSSQGVEKAHSQKDKAYWDLHNGRIEKGETEIETVKREVEEETGLKDIEFADGFKETIKYFFRAEGKNILKFVVFYLAEPKTKDLKISAEHIVIPWLNYRAAM